MGTEQQLSTYIPIRIVLKQQWSFGKANCRHSWICIKCMQGDPIQINQRVKGMGFNSKNYYMLYISHNPCAIRKRITPLIHRDVTKPTNTQKRLGSIVPCACVKSFRVHFVTRRTWIHAVCVHTCIELHAHIVHVHMTYIFILICMWLVLGHAWSITRTDENICVPCYIVVAKNLGIYGWDSEKHALQWRYLYNTYTCIWKQQAYMQRRASKMQEDK